MSERKDKKNEKTNKSQSLVSPFASDGGGACLSNELHSHESELKMASDRDSLPTKGVGQSTLMIKSSTAAARKASRLNGSLSPTPRIKAQNKMPTENTYQRKQHFEQSNSIRTAADVAVSPQLDIRRRRLTSSTTRLSDRAVAAMIPHAARRMPHLPAISSRKVHRKTTASCHYTVLAKTAGDPLARAYDLESRTEAKVFYVLAAHPDVYLIRTQPPQVRYYDECLQTLRRHTPDLIATMTDGTRIAYVVKPWAHTQKDAFRLLIKYLRRDMVPGVVDKVLVRTERHFTDTQIQNAELIHRCSRIADEIADEVIAGLVAKLQGEISISNLIDASGLGARAFSAVVRVIAAGLAHLPYNHLIDYPAILARTVPT
jgi:hypothetical protein